MTRGPRARKGLRSAARRPLPTGGPPPRPGSRTEDRVGQPRLQRKHQRVPQLLRRKPPRPGANPWRRKWEPQQPVPPGLGSACVVDHARTGSPRVRGEQLSRDLWRREVGPFMARGRPRLLRCACALLLGGPVGAGSGVCWALRTASGGVAPRSPPPGTSAALGGAARSGNARPRGARIDGRCGWLERGPVQARSRF